MGIDSQCTSSRPTGRRSSRALLRKTLKHQRSARGPRAGPGLLLLLATSSPPSFRSSRGSRATVQQLLIISKVRKRRRREERGEEEETDRQTDRQTDSSSILAHWSLWIIEKWRPKRGSNIHKDFLKRQTRSEECSDSPARSGATCALTDQRLENQRCRWRRILHLACVCVCVCVCVCAVCVQCV